MKNTLKTAFICTAIFFFANASLSAQEFTSQLKNVKIYNEGAEVSRTATIKLKAGNNEVTLIGLSQYIDLNSIIVNTDDNLSVLGTQFLIRQIEQEEIPAITKLQDSLLFFQEKEADYRIEQTILSEEIQFLKQNYSIGGNNGTTVFELEKVSEYNKKRFTAIYKRQNALNKEINANNMAGRRIRNEINIMREKYPSQPIGAIVLDLIAEKNMTSTIQFSYISSNAGWQPTYEMRSAGIGADIAMAMKANVYQNTGEVWNNISLNLSTGNPNIGMTVPTLSPRYLGFNNYQPVYSKRIDKLRTQELEYKPSTENDTKGSEASDDMYKVANRQDAQVSNNEVAVEYTISEPYSIASSGKPQLILLKSYNIKAIYSYLTIPKVDASVFLTAQLIDWQQHNFSPGEMILIYKNTYVGKSYFNPIAESDTLRISMGKDPKVIVSRVNKRDFTKLRNIGSNKKEFFSYTITLNNNNAEDIKVEILDQIPVSQHSDIEVQLTKADNGELTEKTGSLKWVSEIKAGKIKTIAVEYEVTSPKNQTVYGL